MLGYVITDKNELKVREYEVYQGYYCGICKSIARRCGQVPRMFLSYDAVFLALVLAGLSAEADSFSREHCIIHHLDKKPVIYGNSAVDYAADVMVILAYQKFLDDWKDEKSGSSFAGKTVLAGAYRRLKQAYPTVCEKMETALRKLSSLEAEHCGSVDQTADAFADVLEAMFSGYAPAAGQSRVLAQLARNLGRWIYLIDALDDYEEDREKETYNPLLYRKNNLEGTDDLLYNYLAEISKSYDLLDMKKNQGIVENIIFMGLRQKTDLILSERTKEL